MVAEPTPPGCAPAALAAAEYAQHGVLRCACLAPASSPAPADSAAMPTAATCSPAPLAPCPQRRHAAHHAAGRRVHRGCAWGAGGQAGRQVRAVKPCPVPQPACCPPSPTPHPGASPQPLPPRPPGPSGACVREVCRASGCDIKSWTAEPDARCPRASRVFRCVCVGVGGGHGTPAWGTAQARHGTGRGRRRAGGPRDGGAPDGTPPTLPAPVRRRVEGPRAGVARAVGIM